MFREDRKYKPFAFEGNLFDSMPGAPSGKGGGGKGGGGDRKGQKKDVDALEGAINNLIATMAKESSLVAKSKKEYKALRTTVSNLLKQKGNQSGIDKLILQSHEKLTAQLARETEQRKKLEAQIANSKKKDILAAETTALKKQTKADIDSLKAKQNAIKANNKHSASIKKNRDKLKILSDQYKDTGVKLRDVTKGTDLFKRALKGEARALATIKRRLKEATTAGTKLNKSLGLTVRNTRNVHGSFSVLRSKLLLASFAYALFVSKVVNLVKAYGVQQRAEAAFSSALASTNVSAGQTSRSIKFLAAEIQVLTGVGDENVIASAALLKTFTNLGSQVFPRAQKSIIDVAAGMYQGNVTMEALKTTSIQVGKALNSPIKGMASLSRVGVQFSGEQKIAIKRFVYTNKLAKAQGIILGELETQFGGLGEKIRDTTEGKMLALNSAFSDFQERLGSGIAPAMDAFVESLTKLFKVMESRHIVNFTTGLIASIALFKLYNTTLTFSILKTKLFTSAIFTNIVAMKLWQSATGVGLIIAAGTTLITTLLNVATGFLDSEDAIESSKNKMDELREQWNLMNNAAGQEEVTKKLGERYKKINIELTNHEEKLKNVKLQYAEVAVETNRLESLKVDLLRLEREELQSNQKKIRLKKKEIKAQILLVKGSEKEKIAKQLKIDQTKEMIRLLLIELGKTEDQIELSELLTVVKQKEENAFRATAIVNATEKYSNLAIAQKQLNVIGTSGLAILFGATKRQKLLAKEAAKYGLTVKELEVEQKELTAAINDYADALAKAAAKTQMLSELNKVKQEAFNLMSTLADQEMAKQDAIMNNDIENAKKSSAYKMASKRGDTRMMEKLEKEARKKTLPDRVKAFNDKKNVAIGGVLIDAAGAIIKAFRDYGFLPGLAISGLIATSSALQLATINQQRPPKFAKGGDFITSGPEMIMVGDNPGGRERVSVTPLSSPNLDGPQGGSPINITFTGNVMSQDFIEGEAIPMIKEAIRRGADIGIS